MIIARNNPFASHRIDALSYRFLDGGWPDLLMRLEALGYRAAIMGPYGSGKTTLLAQLARILRSRGRHVNLLFVNTDKPRLSVAQMAALLKSIRTRQMVMIDGADLLPHWQWGLIRGASRFAGGLVVAGHSPKGLPVLIRCRPHIHILTRLLQDLNVRLSPGTIEDLFNTYAGNIREIWRELYLKTAHGYQDRPSTTGSTLIR